MSVTFDDSRIAWFGALPEGWQVFRGKRLFRREHRTPSPGDEIVTAFRDGTVTLRRNRREDGFTVALQEHGYQGIRRGDLVIHAMDAFAGAIGISDSDGKATPVYAACTPIRPLNSWYYCHLLRHMAKSGFIETLARGIRERSTEFKFPEFASLSLPFPPVEEQDAIVRFLEEKERDIEHYLATKRRMIEVLDRGVRSRLSTIITGEANGSPQSTSSAYHPLIGIGWRLMPLRRLVWKVADGPHFSPEYVTSDLGRPFLSAGNIRPNGWNLSSVKHISEDDFREFSRRIVPTRGDVLYTKGGTTGVATFVDLDFPFQVWVHIAVLKVNHDWVDPEYLAFALNGHGCYEQSQLHTKGATNQDLGLTRMVNIEVPVPPLEQQQVLVKQMREVTASFESVRSSLEREIAVMEEYRTRLIADAVTRQIDVRRAT